MQTNPELFGSSAPARVSLVIDTFARYWNRALKSDAERDRLLKDLIPLMVGTRTTQVDDYTRALMVMDWMVREFAPAWLDLVSALATHAAALRAIPPVKSWGILEAQITVIANAATSAKNAIPEGIRRDIAGVAGANEWDATGTAGAAGIVTWAAAPNAHAWFVAWEATRNATKAGIRNASRADIEKTTTKLQESARDLIRRMCAVGR